MLKEAVYKEALLYGINVLFLNFFLVLLSLVSDKQKQSQKKIITYDIFGLGGGFGPKSQIKHSLLNITLEYDCFLLGV